MHDLLTGYLVVFLWLLLFFAALVLLVLAEGERAHVKGYGIPSAETFGADGSVGPTQERK